MNWTLSRRQRSLADGLALDQLDDWDGESAAGGTFLGAAGTEPCVGVAVPAVGSV